MERRVDHETDRVVRGLLVLRLGLLVPFLVIAGDRSCTPALTAGLVLLLLAMAGLPTLAYFFRRGLLTHPRAHYGIAMLDFLAISLLNLLAAVHHGPPLFFPLYFLLALEAACWWGWPGALTSGAAGGIVLSLLYLYVPQRHSNLGLAMVAVTLGWSVVLGYFTQWAMRQWREGRRLAGQLAHQERALQRAWERLQGWEKTWTALRQESSPQALLKTVLAEAIDGTGSTLGLVTMRDPEDGDTRVQCWQGFSLPGPDTRNLHPGDRMPSPDGAIPMEVLHVLQAPLRAAAAARSDDGEQTWGQIVVARHRGLPYHDTEEQWLHLLAGYAAVVLENSFLQGQLGRIRQEADSIVLAGWTLASLPNPAAAMEMACRKILGTLDLHQVVIFLYRDDDGSGCHVITYPADGPTLTAQCSLRGRGLSLLQRFLDGGTALVINRRREYPDLFSAMGWDDPVQAAACFPLYVLQHRWGVLCLLAKTAGAFPAQTQQNLAIFSGEVAMALENSYLRQACARARNVQEEATKREEPAVRPHRSSQRLADSREGTREHQDRTATVEPARSPEKYLQYEEIPVHSGA